MPRLLKSALAALLTLLVLPLLLLFASGSTNVANAALPSQLGIDSADDEDGDDGGDEDEGEDEEDDSDDTDDSADAEESEESAESEESEEYEASEEITAEESAEYSEEYAYFESSESFASEEYAAWSYDVQLTSVSSSQWGYNFSAPSGGSHPSPASLGLDTSGDIEYPFVWQNDGSDELLFDTIVLAVYDHGSPLSATDFAAIADAEDADLHAEFPTDLVAPEQHMLGSHKWVYNAYGGGPDGAEVDVFSTMDGDKYYSFYFVGSDPGSQAQVAWDQMAAIVASFQ